MSVRYLQVCQDFLNKLQYNNEIPKFDVRKCCTLGSLEFEAKQMTLKNKPLKCLEALVLAVFLTKKLQVVRFPLAFKSFSNGKHEHIVLGVYVPGIKKWGSMGLSRCSDLMDKPFIYDSLQQLVDEFEKSYVKRTFFLT